MHLVAYPHFLIIPKMYRTLLIICLLLSLTACHDKGRVVEPKPGPAHLMLLKTEYNFGIVTDKQATVVREIPLINDGSEPLTITDVQTSCHCLSAEVSPEPIAPGHYTQLKATLVVSDVSVGDYMRTIDLKTSDGNVTTITVTGSKIASNP